MRQFPSDIAFTPAVKSVQEAKGSRANYAKVEQGRGWKTRVTADLAGFLAGLDMFYLGTANAEGQPYIQYRGGSPGFLKVLDDRTLAFADFGGNRQYITRCAQRDVAPAIAELQARITELELALEAARQGNPEKD